MERKTRSLSPRHLEVGEKRIPSVQRPTPAYLQDTWDRSRLHPSPSVRTDISTDHKKTEASSSTDSNRSSIRRRRNRSKDNDDPGTLSRRSDIGAMAKANLRHTAEQSRVDGSKDLTTKTHKLLNVGDSTSGRSEKAREKRVKSSIRETSSSPTRTLSHATEQRSTLQANDAVLREPLQKPESKPWMEIRRQLGSKAAHPMEPFLQYNDENAFTIADALKIKAECPAKLLSELQSPIVPTDAPCKAWIDERSCTPRSGRSHREHSNPVSAYGLYRIVQRPLIGDLVDPDADRRLIYIENLDGSYAYALSETVGEHQRAALRDAIASHFGFGSKFSYHVSRLLKVFRISMYLVTPVVLLQEDIKQRPPRRPWLDTEFTQEGTQSPEESKVAGMYSARRTFEMCGHAYSRYTAWAFCDLIHGSEPIGEKEFIYGTPDESQGTGPHEDPIASGASLDANFPIFDGRTYALQVFLCHMKRAHRDWKNAIDILKESFETHRQRVSEVSEQYSQVPKASSHQQHKLLSSEYRRNRKWTNLNSRLLEMLRDCLAKLDEFCVSSRGLAFLVRGQPIALGDNRATRVEILAILEELRGLLRELEQRNKTCDGITADLDLWLKLGGEARSVEATHTAMVTVQYIMPLTLVIGMCSMNPGFLLVTPSKVGLLAVTFVAYPLFWMLQSIIRQLDERSYWWEVGAGVCGRWKRWTKETLLRLRGNHIGANVDHEAIPDDEASSSNGEVTDDSRTS